jgi:urease accessory protein
MVLSETSSGYDAGMQLAEPLVSSWKARLALDFAFRNERTVLAGRSHDGPLVVQKPLYPEGDALCHAIVVHPPGGIAGGDELALSATVGAESAALLTTPAAAKWYRSAGAWAKQEVAFDVTGTLEWLPQETIFFDGALATMTTSVDLAPGASYIGWEILCLGRTGSGERFRRGALLVATEVRRAGKLLWFERARIDGGGALLASPAGFGGHTVCGTLVATGTIDAALVAECRSDSNVVLTCPPGLVVGRYLGDSSERAKFSLARLWQRLRPALLGRTAVEPRIWRT